MKRRGILGAVGITILVLAGLRIALALFSFHPGRPLIPTAFPSVKDWNSVKITLHRGVCFGTCPDYDLEVDGDGTVHYQGRDFVILSGKDQSKISPQTVRALLAAFQKAEFYWLFDRYAAAITDGPTYQIGISIDGHDKKVTDYLGTAVGMPLVVRDLEKQIDKVAGTERWVRGNGETVSLLKARGWDFHSADDANRKLLRDAANILWRGAGNASEIAYMTQLLQAGMQADSDAGCAALSAALKQHAFDLAGLLIGAHAPLKGADGPGDRQSCDVRADSQADAQAASWLKAHFP